MFSRISRYHPLDDEVTVDAAGRRLRSRALRIQPPVEGTYRHTIVDGERLDQLADRYYRQPRNWWRICDANPEFLAPQALLGTDPVVTHRFTVTPPGAGTPPWAALLRALTGTVGVLRAVLDAGLVAITFNRLTVTVPQLAAVMTANGFTATGASADGRAGRTIVIPPAVNG